MKKLLNLVSASAGIACVLWACDTSSVSAFLFDADKERELGAEFNATLTDSIGGQILEPTHPFAKYADSLKNELVATISAEDWESVKPSNVESREKFFTVQVINDPTQNAFAVPGGYFYLYTGILETMADESELVAVMGHEIGHVLGHHSRDRILKATALSSALNIFLGEEGGATALVAELGGAYFLNENGKDDELESDAYGVEFSKNIKVKPTGIETYFGKGIVDEQGNCNDDSSWYEGVFSTHPPHCERVEQAQKIVSGYTAEEKAYSVNKERYDSMVATIKE